MCDAVFALGSAAYLLDDPRYAQRAARDINTWFINPKTRMTPSLEYAQAIRNLNSGRGAGIVDGRSFIRAIQGMEFLAQTGNWDPKEQAAVRKWFQEYLHWLTTSDYGNNEKRAGNNHASWWTAQVAAVAGFVEDDVNQKMPPSTTTATTFSRARSSRTAPPRAKKRAPGVSGIRPSIWRPLSPPAASPRCRGVDLWSVHAKGGATISTVIDYLLPYLADPKKWTKEQVTDFSNDGFTFWRLPEWG